MSLHAFPSSEGKAQKSSTPVGRGTRETRLPIPVRAGTTLSVPRKSGHQVEGPRRSISPMEKSKRPQESYAIAHAGRTAPTASKYLPNAPHRLSRSPGQPSETPTLVSTKRHGMAIQNRPDLDQKQSSILAMSPSTSEDLKSQTASRTTSRGPAASDQSHPANFIVPELRSLVAAPALYPVPPSTPHIANTATPSTAYSESPGVWSSRNTTPTTMSSYSPGMTQSLNFSPQRSQKSSLGHPSVRPEGQQETPSPDVQDVTEQSVAQNGKPTRLLSLEPTPHTEPADIIPRRRRSKSLGAAAPHSPPPRKSSKKFSSPKKLVRPRELQRSSERSHILERQNPQAFHDLVSDENQRNVQIPTRPSRHGVSGPVLQPYPVLQSDLSPLQVRPYTRSRPEKSGSLNQMLRPMSSDRESRREDQPRENPSLRQAKTETTNRSLTSGRDLKLPVSSQALVIDRSFRLGAIHPDMEDQMVPPLSKPEKASSRFGFFGRKSKSRKDQDRAIDTLKTSRKGPAAGTGHEGYKYGHTSRGRKMSTGSLTRRRDQSASTTASTSRSMSSHQSSVTSGVDSDMDDFLSQRLEPVVIRGGGGPLGSNPSFANLDREQTPNVRSEREPPLKSDIGSVDGTKPLVWGPGQSSMPFSSDVSSPSIATRRSLLHVTKDSNHTPPRSLSPLQIAPKSKVESPLPSYDTGISSYTSADNSATSAMAHDILPTKARLDPNKKTKVKKWNIFSKAHPQEMRTPSPQADTDLRSRMPAAISSVASTKPTAFYAIMDPDNELEDALIFDSPLDYAESPPIFEEASSFSQAKSLKHVLRRQQGYSLLLPSPPILPQQPTSDSWEPSTRVYLSRDSFAGQLAPEAKPDRLVQVGRIPKVVSNRDRAHIPPSQSFSRPFVRHDSISTAAENSHTAARSLPDKDRGNLTRTLSTQTAGTDPFLALRGSPNDQESIIVPKADEFLSFTGLAQSGIFESSSSGQFAIAGTVPNMAHEEVWREYDDLIDQVISPSKEPSREQRLPSLSETNSTTPSPQTYSFMSRTETRGIQSAQRGQESTFVPEPLRVRTSSQLHHTLGSAKSTESVRLRRSRIVSALHSSATPSSPVSIRDLFADYLKLDDGLSNVAPRVSQTSEAYVSNESSVLDLDHIPEDTDGPSRQLSTTLLDIAQRDRDGPIALSNLRFGALATSRWLSFGRVLVSPAHEKVDTSHGDRILVIDGLGNDDWSFYCAETYPGAKVYNLSVRDPVPPQSTKRTSWQAPQNHENVNHPRMTESFPFPTAFFAAVVLRFPYAMPEYALKRTVSECKRVLRPGGYIELSVLDLDIVDMGSRTRRAVRDLKVRLNEAEPEVCLKPAGDNIQKLLGRKGFENLTRCMVSVPVAGAIGSITSESSRASHGSQGGHSSAGSVLSGPNPPPTRIFNRARMSDQNFSLCELISDQSPEGDDQVADLVARVGRYFFTRCYEQAVIPDGDLQRSIWADKRLLRECEARGSGFKLLTAYAQKPLHTRKRTMSEPTKPTPAVVDTMLMKEYDNMRYHYDLR